MNKYDSIINLPHHTSKVHTLMPMEGRAAQFAPFAALTGYDETICEAARYTSDRIELSDDESRRLNCRMEYALSLAEAPELIITHFVADKQKCGGQYVRTSGRIKKVDVYKRVVILIGGKTIALDDILSLDGAAFDVFY